jgi:H+-transporting ATPase
MIVMLALLNDGAILSIAYDNVHYKDQPEAWNMSMVLGISTALGVIGVVAAFGLFYLGERVFHLDRAHIQTLMYLKLSVAGHLTIFLTRTRGRFWSIRPAKILWIAVLGTQIVATLIAVYGLFMTPIGWGWAGFVWGYALLWFLVNDNVKLLAYRIFDPAKAEVKPEVKAGSKADPKPDAKPEVKPEAKAEPKTDSKAEPKTQSKPESEPKADAKPDAEGDTKISAKADAKPEAKAETKAEDKADPNPEVKAGSNTDPKPDVNSEVKPETKDEPKTDSKAAPKPEANAEAETKIKTAEPKPDAKAEPKSETKAEPQPEAEAKSKTPSDLTPGLVKRVHKLYEELGREDIQAVQDWEKAERETRKDEPNK